MTLRKKAVDLKSFLPDEDTEQQIALETFHVLSDADVTAASDDLRLKLETFKDAGDAVIEAKATGLMSRVALEDTGAELPAEYPLNGFTRHPTKTNYAVGLESLAQNFIKAFRSLFTGVVNLSSHLSKWVDKRMRKIAPVEGASLSNATTRLLKTKEAVSEDTDLLRYITTPRSWSYLIEVLLFNKTVSESLFDQTVLGSLPKLLLNDGLSDFFNQIVTLLNSATSGEQLNTALRSLLDDTLSMDDITRLEDASDVLDDSSRRWQRTPAQTDYHQYIADTEKTPFNISELVGGFSDAHSVAEALLNGLTATEKNITKLNPTKFPEDATAQDVEVFQVLTQEIQMLTLTLLEKGTEYMMNLVTLMTVKEEHEEQLALDRVHYAELLEQQPV